MKRRFLAVTCALAILSLAVVGAAQLGSVVKGGAIGLAVSKFGPQINDALNTLMGQHNARISQVTKVVPILSIGDSGYIGAVQVTGPKAAVQKVQAVAQLEGRFRAIGGVRLRALVPISTKTPHKGIDRIEGVGISAIVDFKL
jgi:hypothetical protein